MTITSLTLHFFEPGPLALLFPRQKKKNPQPVVYRIAPRIVNALAIVEPATVIRRHRAGFRLFWLISTP